MFSVEVALRPTPVFSEGGEKVVLKSGAVTLS